MTNPETWEQWLVALAPAGIAILAGLVAHTVLFTLLRLGAKRAGGGIRSEIVKALRAPSRVAIPAIAVGFVVREDPSAGLAFLLLKRAVSLAVVAAVTWLLVRLAGVAESAARSRLDISVADNLLARRALTRIQIIRKTLVVVIVIIGAGVALMTIPQVRQVGAGLLASAGVAGLIVALAARPTAENLLAGIQIALTQPINLDDVVVVEGEWGRIEEINPTYVVVHIWDSRRLILPINWFLQNPFQNWTRTSADILGSVLLHFDYAVPIAELRAELDRIVKSNPRWDGRVANVQVVNAHERTIEVRALVSAADSPTAWDLRCEVREALIDFVRNKYPESLPRLRAEVRNWPAPEVESAA